MAQYESDHNGEDIYDVSDPVDSFDYASLNNDNPAEGNEYSPKDAVVPLAMNDTNGTQQGKQAGKKENQNSNPNKNEAKEMLLRICEEEGILMTAVMESQIIRMCHKMGANEENIYFFVKGYSTCLTSHIVASMQDSAKEIRIEVKRLQSQAITISQKTEVLNTAAEALTKKIDTVRDDVREKIHSSLENIESFVSDALTSMKTASKVGSEDGEREKAASATIEVKPDIRNEDKAKQKVEQKEIVVPEKIVEHPAVGSSSSVTVADDTDPISIRRALMSRVGFHSSVCTSITSDVIMAAIPPALMSELKSATFTPKIKIAVRKIITNNINSMAAKT